VISDRDVWAAALLMPTEPDQRAASFCFMPEKSARTRKAREPMKVEGANRSKAHIRSGGIVHGKRDPLRHVPLREPYAARSGASPEEQGTPEGRDQGQAKIKDARPNETGLTPPPAPRRGTPV
jgi:hypothetical protein